MQKSNGFKLAAIVWVISLVLLPPQAYAGPNCHKNPDHSSCTSGGGDGGSGDGEIAFDPAGCANATGSFPGLAYEKHTFSRSGRLKSVQIWLSDTNASCAVMVYESNEAIDGAPSLHYSDGSGTLVWKGQGGGKPSPTNAIFSAPFQVDNDNVVTSTLPLQPTLIWEDGAQLLEIDMTLSPDGSRIAFPVVEGRLNEDGYTTVSLLVCDVDNCIPDTAFTRTQLAGEPDAGGSREVAWGTSATDGDRLYFLHRLNATFAGGDLVAIDDLGNGEWSSPAVVLENSTGLAWRAPASVSLSDGSADCVSFSSQNGLEGQIRYHVAQVAKDLSKSSILLTPSSTNGRITTWVSRPTMACSSGHLWSSAQDNQMSINSVNIGADMSSSTGLIGAAVDSAL